MYLIKLYYCYHTPVKIDYCSIFLNDILQQMCAQDLEQVLVQGFYSRFATAKFARYNHPLTAREVEISTLYTTGLSELPKQH